MAEMDKRGGPKEEEVTVLDIDMLCSAVALQAQKGNWGKVNIGDSEEENLVTDCHQYGGGVLRMWEGELVYDCFDDRRIALQSTWYLILVNSSLRCPCYRFGKNMKLAGFGSCFLQGSIHLILALFALSNLLAFIITGGHFFLYLAISFTFSVGTYMGYYRMQMAKKFNIRGGDGSFDDCAYHLICPCCTLCQESRTLEMNNVQDGIWHGRGDTICIGSFSEESKEYLELIPPLVVSTNSPEFITMQKASNDSVHL